MIESFVLINPPSKRLGDDKVAAPLGILYIASYIREIIKYPVEYIDFTGKSMPEIPIQMLKLLLVVLILLLYPRNVFKMELILW
jgi:hypothetical protein